MRRATSGDARAWRAWAEWVLSRYPADEEGDTFFHEGPPLTGTIGERALYAYFLAESGEPF